MATLAPSIDMKANTNQMNKVLGIGLLIILAVGVGIWLMVGNGLTFVLNWVGAVDRVVFWLGLIAAMVGLLALIGHAATNSWLGVLIDSTNMMSLSRLQVVLWTVIILSAYLVIAIPRIVGPMTKLDQVPGSDPFLTECMKGKPTVYEPTIADCGGGPLQITFPPEVLLAMGISLAAFAGSHLIQNNKANQAGDTKGSQTKTQQAQDAFDAAQKAYNGAMDASKQPSLDYANAKDAYDLADAAVKNPQSGVTAADLAGKLSQAKFFLDTVQVRYQRTQTDKDTALKALNAAQQDLDAATKQEQAAETEAEGKLHKNDSPAQASWSEIFRGNEINTYQQVSMGKVQMFFFTFVVLVAYAAAIADMLHTGTALLNPLGVAFPTFSAGLVALLGLSQGTYLVNKATTQS